MTYFLSADGDSGNGGGEALPGGASGIAGEASQDLVQDTISLTPN
jgi:hypothetical protein